MTSKGAWTEHYADLTDPEPYGDDTSYRMADAWTAECATVADWGCGKGYMRKFIPPERYIGIDGSPSRFADRVEDLTEYRVKTEGVILRHVLEHEHEWESILDNAVASYTKRLFIAVFTPSVDRTHVLMTEPEYGDVPVVAFNTDDILDRIAGEWTSHAYRTGTFYGAETIIRAKR